MIRIIVALDTARGIAKQGIQPWKISKDEAYFYQKTTSKGARVLMGVKTYEAIGKPLKDRENIIVSTRMGITTGVRVVSDLETFMQDNQDDVWVIGGADIYDQTLKYAEELYVTAILADFGCDQYFPKYTPQFKLDSSSDLQTEHGFIFRYDKYVRA